MPELTQEMYEALDDLRVAKELYFNCLYTQLPNARAELIKQAQRVVWEFEREYYDGPDD